MIIKIHSKNSYLLDILHKNPNTDFGLYAKKMKNGVALGNCIDENNYEVIFQDTKYSYLPEDSNAIDFQSYCNPLVAIHVCNEFFSHLQKSNEAYFNTNIKWLQKNYQEIDTESCEIIIPNFYINSSWMKENDFMLSKYFSQIKTKYLIGKNYELIIKAKSVYEAINVLSLTAVFTHLTNNYGVFTFIDDFFAEKNARILTNIDNVPYFVFYLFIKKAIKTREQFNLITPTLEAYFEKRGQKVIFKYSYNHAERVNFICNKLSLKNKILDVGCGEFIYYRKLTKQGYELPYFAIDEDENFSKIAENVIQKLNTNNLKFYTNLSDFENLNINEPLDILLTEVIEHNSLESAKELINKLVTYNFNQIFITTPNKDFNQYYFEDDETMRHDDHDFELTTEEFKNFMNSCDIQNFKLEYHPIGDIIDGVAPTQACIITKN